MPDKKGKPYDVFGALEKAGLLSKCDVATDNVVVHIIIRNGDSLHDRIGTAEWLSWAKAHDSELPDRPDWL